MIQLDVTTPTIGTLNQFSLPLYPRKTCTRTDFMHVIVGAQQAYLLPLH